MNISASTPVRRTICAVVALSIALMAIFAGSTASHAATTITNTTSVPISEQGYIQCARDGAGEFIRFSGEMHLLTHITIDSTGGAHVTYHYNYAGVSGVGLTTGDTYQISHVLKGQTMSRSLPFTFDFNDNFHAVGQGPNNDLTVHTKVHVTVNANGESTAYVDELRMECKTTGNTPTPTPTPNPYPAP